MNKLREMTEEEKKTDILNKLKGLESIGITMSRDYNRSYSIEELQTEYIYRLEQNNRNELEIKKIESELEIKKFESELEMKKLENEHDLEMKKLENEHELLMKKLESLISSFN